MNAHKTLGKRIYYARVYAGPRLMKDFGVAVANKAGRDKPYSSCSVSEWEADHTLPDLPVLLAIAEAGPVRPEWLLLGKGEPT